MSDIKVPQELSKETPDENVQQEQPQVPPPRQQDDATLIEESSKENEVTSALVVVPSDEERKRKNVDDSTKVEEVEVEAITTIENQVEAVENSNSHRDETNEDSDDDDESDSEPKKQTSALPPRPIKRARTAYFIFTDEKRPVVQAEVSSQKLEFLAVDSFYLGNYHLYIYVFTH